MIKFEDYIFAEFYTDYDKATDLNKDANGKGTNERFIGMVGSIIDELIPYISNIGANLIEPKTLLEQYIPYHESEVGYSKDWIWFFTLPSSFRRHLIAIMPKLLTIRTTIPAHQIMFSWLGMITTITEDFSYVTGLDSSLEMDSIFRTWDSGAVTCTGYQVDLNGPVLDFTAGYSSNYNSNYFHATSYLDAIYTILLFNQPINADLNLITYNGSDITNYFTNSRYSKLNLNIITP